jgi:hypothetical protein
MLFSTFAYYWKLGGMVSAPRQLNIGQIYYIIQYKDEKLARPIVSSFKYAGRIEKDADASEHRFTLLGFANEELFLRESDLTIVLDLAGLIKELSTPNLAHNGIDHAS